jgi:ATP-binding cassette subfamily B protein
MNKPFIIIQHDSNDCGAICLLTISKYYGCDNRLEYLRQICGTSTSGTSLFGLYAAAKKLGFKATGSVADNNFLISHNKPTILHVTLDNNQEHYVVCWGYSKGKFVIGDPSIGLKHLSNFELEKIWLSKACLIIKPNPVLHLKNKFRVQWLKSIKNYIKPDLNKLYDYP